jgi:hypothetical protein
MPPRGSDPEIKLTVELALDGFVDAAKQEFEQRITKTPEEQRKEENWPNYIHLQNIHVSSASAAPIKMNDLFSPA